MTTSLSLPANPRNPPAQREDPQRRLFQSDRRTISGDRRAQQIDFVFEQRALALYVSRRRYSAQPPAFDPARRPAIRARRGL